MLSWYNNWLHVNVKTILFISFRLALTMQKCSVAFWILKKSMNPRKYFSNLLHLKTMVRTRFQAVVSWALKRIWEVSIGAFRQFSGNSDDFLFYLHRFRLDISWSKRGCDVGKNKEGRTECLCNHFTNFAVLTDVHQVPVSTYSLKKRNCNATHVKSHNLLTTY